MSETPSVSSMPKRHPATAATWNWLENGEGRNYPPGVRKAIRTKLLEVDAMFIAWDEEHSE